MISTNPNFIKSYAEKVITRKVAFECTHMLLWLYMLRNHSKADTYNGIIDSLLDTISENIGDAETQPYGIQGIGTMIEIISRTGFIDINTNEILEDVDDLIYKKTVYTGYSSPDIEQGLISALAYFYYRFTNIYPENRYRFIANQEIIFVLINVIKEKWKYEEDFLVKNMTATSQCLFFLSLLYKYPLFQLMVDDVTYKLVSSIDDLLSKQVTQGHNQNSNQLMFLIFSYYLAGKNYNHKYWIERGLYFFNNFYDKKMEISNPTLLILEEFFIDKYILDKNISLKNIENETLKVINIWTTINDQNSRLWEQYLLFSIDYPFYKSLIN